MHAVKIACERPEVRGRSLATWDCQEIANELVRASIVEQISVRTVQRILSHHKLKPWRYHAWLSFDVRRDTDFLTHTQAICDLYTRALLSTEQVWSVDEKTSIQPRPRVKPTRGAAPRRAVQVEHEYKRDGALNLLAGFNTRTGEVVGLCRPRKRQAEFIEFLMKLDAQVPPEVTKLHVVLDNLIMHKGKEVQRWLAAHPRIQFHFTPVHCSWMNQIEQWFSVLHRKRLRFVDFTSKEHLERAIMLFIEQHNEHPHPFQWNTKSAAKVMAWAERKVMSFAREVLAAA